MTQSVSSFYAAMKGETGKHKAEALLANFTTVIAHACDRGDGEMAGRKARQEKSKFYSAEVRLRANRRWDDLYGNSRFNGSFSEHCEHVLQDHEFMVGQLRRPGQRLSG